MGGECSRTRLPNLRSAKVFGSPEVCVNCANTEDVCELAHLLKKFSHVVSDEIGRIG